MKGNQLSAEGRGREFQFPRKLLAKLRLKFLGQSADWLAASLSSSEMNCRYI